MEIPASENLENKINPANRQAAIIRTANTPESLDSQNSSKNFWSKMVVNGVSHFLMFIGLATFILSILFIFFSEAEGTNILLCVTMLIYSLSSVIVGKIGTYITKKYELHKSSYFVYGIYYITVFNVVLIGLNFYLKLVEALESYDRAKDQWKEISDEISNLKIQHFVNVFKFNTVVSYVCLIVHCITIQKLRESLQILKASII